MENPKPRHLELDTDRYEYLPTDEELTEELCQLLFDDPNIDSSQIEIEVNNGCVELRGSVPAMEMVQQAETLTRDFPGVIQILNRLTYNSRSMRAAKG
jgi:osmotically-inducible protein OsmY